MDEVGEGIPSEPVLLDEGSDRVGVEADVGVMVKTPDVVVEEGSPCVSVMVVGEEIVVVCVPVTGVVMVEVTVSESMVCGNLHGYRT